MKMMERFVSMLGTHFITVAEFNRQQMSDRKKVFDQDIRMIENSYGTFVDHTKMKGHVFADFQKRMFQEFAKEAYKSFATFELRIQVAESTHLHSHRQKSMRRPWQ